MLPDGSELSFMDTATLEEVVKNLVEYIPTWEELERFTDDAIRLPIPQFEKRALAWIEPDGQTNPFQGDHMQNVLNFNQGFIDQFGGNMSSALMAPLPPFFGPNGEENIYPIPLTYLDEKLRAVAVSFLYEKSLGLPVTFVNFYPPHIESEKFASKAAFEQWFEDRFLPEKRAEAAAAEIMKAEKFMPWPLEFELFITDIGGIGDGGFLEGSSADDILDFATDVKNRILAAVKSNYSGRVVAHLFNNYHQRPESHFWDRMTYEGFDEIHFAIFGNFDVEGTLNALDEQLIHYAKIVQNSGDIPWIASEISMFESNIQAGKLNEIEKELYESVFARLETASIPPKGISPAGGYLRTARAREFVRDYFATH